MAEYFVIKQDLLTLDPPPVLGPLPYEIEPLDFINGRRITFREEPIELPLTETSGDFQPDMITYLLPLFSERLKNELTRLGIDNIDYFKTHLVHPKTGTIIKNYWLANIIGCIECVDISNSVREYDDLLDSYNIKSFTIDNNIVGNARFFRLAEKSKLIIIHEIIKNELDKMKLKGVQVRNTRDYDGF